MGVQVVHGRLRQYWQSKGGRQEAATIAPPLGSYAENSATCTASAWCTGRNEEKTPNLQNDVFHRYSLIPAIAGAAARHDTVSQHNTLRLSAYDSGTNISDIHSDYHTSRNEWCTAFQLPNENQAIWLQIRLPVVKIRLDDQI